MAHYPIARYFYLKLSASFSGTRAHFLGFCLGFGLFRFLALAWLFPALSFLDFFLLPHQIKKPETGKEAHSRLAQKARNLPANPNMAPVWMS